MLPPLADIQSLDNRVPGGIPSGDTARALALLEDASALVRAEAGKTWVDEAGALEDVPDTIAAVTMTAAKRAFINPDAVRSESIDGYRTDYPTESFGVYLTKAECRLVRQMAGKSGLWTQSTTRSEDDIPDVPSVGVDASGSPVEETDPFAMGWK